MKLSTRIHDHIDEATPYRTAVIACGTLDNWERAADRLERDRRAAWVSFYVACGCVGLLFAFAIYQRFASYPQCGAALPANPSHIQAVWL